MYDMRAARKGKACVIKLHQFEVTWLDPLTGYNVDDQRLCELWDGLGFDVYQPEISPNRCLTANVGYHEPYL